MDMSRIERREFHRFEAAGQQFLYLVPSAAVFALDECSGAVLDHLDGAPADQQALAAALAGQFDSAAVADAVGELRRVRAIGDAAVVTSRPKIMPLRPVPLQTLVVNVTNQCNLSCTYCYEYGEDKIVDTENGKQPKFMSEETARESVEFLLREARESPTAHMTFFGGETLLNFPVLKSTIAYARRRAAEVGKEIDFSLTTNATLLRPDVIEFLAENRVGVTISIDGPEELQDRFRVFKNGAGSYDVVAPKIKALLARHRSRPIGARVTLTRQTLDVTRIYRHLADEMGFWEVGFAPVTTAPTRDYAISDGGFDDLLAQFRRLAEEYRDAALANRHHGFSNVRETLQEIHQGHAKAYPCGAGLGLMGVATDGDVALCHRFAGSESHQLGDVRNGVSWEQQQAFLESHHIEAKTDCRTCWARPICAGGCYHEANTRYGSTERPNLHYCEWIRGWTHTCLEIYGEIALKNPAFLRQFDGDVAERVS
jgi:uncharacterized protein